MKYTLLELLTCCIYKSGRNRTVDSTAIADELLDTRDDAKSPASNTGIPSLFPKPYDCNLSQFISDNMDDDKKYLFNDRNKILLCYATLQALQKVHSHSISHRDLEKSNFIVKLNAKKEICSIDLQDNDTSEALDNKGKSDDICQLGDLFLDIFGVDDHAEMENSELADLVSKMVSYYEKERPSLDVIESVLKKLNSGNCLDLSKTPITYEKRIKSIDNIVRLPLRLQM